MEETKRLCSMPYFKVWWKAKIHSAEWVHWAAGRKVHQCGGAAWEKKEVLYYKARHRSQIFSLCWVWKLHTLQQNAVQSHSSEKATCQCFCLDKFNSDQVSIHARVVQQRQCEGNQHCSQSLQAICSPDTAALLQLDNSVNTEGKKRCSIVLQRLERCLGIVTPWPPESSFPWMDTGGSLRQDVTAALPQTKRTGYNTEVLTLAPR